MQLEIGGEVVDLETSRKTNPKSVAPILRDLIARQTAELVCEKSQQNIAILSDSSSPYLERVLKSPMWDELYSQAVSAFCLPNLSIDENRQIRGRFAGAFFETSAYWWNVIGNQNPDVIFLDHNRTLALFQSMFKQAHPMSHLFGADSLLGVYVPDFLEVDLAKNPPKISRGLDAKAGADLKYLPEFLLCSRVFGDDCLDFPEVFNSDAPLIFCVPPRSPMKRMLKENSELGFEDMPFSSKALGQFINWTINQYRPDEENSATLAEIHNRVRTQEKRYLSEIWTKPLTPEVRMYLGKTLAPIPDAKFGNFENTEGPYQHLRIIF